MLLKVATEKQFNQRTFAMHYLNQILLPFLTPKMDFAIYTLLAIPLETTSTWLLIFISFYVNELVTNSFFQCILLNITSICFLYRILYTRLLIPFFTAYLFSIFLFWLITDWYGFMYIFCKNIETPCAIVYRFFFECVRIQGYLMHFQKENHVIFTRQNIAYTHYCFGDTSVSKVI